MKKIMSPLMIVMYLLLVNNKSSSQNIFPSTGRAGIYTTSPAASLQIKGGARIGTTANYVNIDSATGNLSFAGTSGYSVAGNKYAFQYSGNPNYGLFFNSTSVQYEFRNGSAAPVFSVNANTGNSLFNGTLKVGAYTLPAIDGSNGQVLKSNGAGVLTWSADNNTTYSAGTGISISGTTITNSAPDKTVALAAGTGISVTGTYPNFTVTNTSPSNNAWSLTGNAGTNASANFIGTTDAQSLVFKVNNTWAGILDNSTFNTGTRNTAFGIRSLFSNTTGIENTANGYGTLFSNVDGNDNSAFGKYALFTNNHGSYNTALGYNSMFFNTTGSNNTATGIVALQNNTTGVENTANGSNALAGNQTGNDNTATGFGALNSNAENYNTATGAYALYSNTSGYSNVAIGIRALYHNTNAHNLVAIGDSALFNQSAIFDGGEFPVHGDNTGVGSKALYTNTEGQRNTAVGSLSLYSTQGNNGAASYNTSIGFGALFNNISGSENTALGSLSDVSNGSRFNGTSVGYNAITTADNQVMLGNTFVTSVMAAGSITIVSDGRFKKNIKENVPGLAFVNQLKPVTYNYDIHALNKMIAPTNASEKKVESSDMQKRDETAITTKEKIVYTGFVAQDVEAVAKKMNYDFSGVHKPQNDKDPYALSYSDFVVPLVKAVQELSKINDAKDAKIDTLQNQLNDLRNLVLSIQQKQESCSPCSAAVSQQTQSYSTILTDASSLQQNVPNPFNHTTTINYSLPQKFASAQIMITDKTGKNLKAVNISGSGKGSLNVDAATLSSGAYNYSLIVDGKIIGTKQMVLTR